MKPTLASRPLRAICAFVLALSALVEAQSPIVRRVEPPNWWVNFTPEVSVLLTGENLSGASVASNSKAAKVLGAEASSNGHYLFVRLKLSPSRPETVQLRLQTSSG